MAVKDCVRFIGGSLVREQMSDNDVQSTLLAIERTGVYVNERQVEDWGTVFCVGSIHPILVLLNKERCDSWLLLHYEGLLLSLRNTSEQKECRITNWLNDVHINFVDPNNSKDHATICDR